MMPVMKVGCEPGSRFRFRIALRATGAIPGKSLSHTNKFLGMV